MPIDPNWLDQLLTKQVESNGTLLPVRQAINFIGFTVADNLSNNSTDVTSAASASPINPLALPNNWVDWRGDFGTTFSGGYNLTQWLDAGPSGHTMSSFGNAPQFTSFNGVTGVFFGNADANGSSGASVAPTVFASFTIFMVMAPRNPGSPNLPLTAASNMLVHNNSMTSGYGSSFTIATGATIASNIALNVNSGANVCEGGMLADKKSTVISATFDSSTPGGGTGTAILRQDGVQIATTTFPTPTSGSTAPVQWGMASNFTFPFAGAELIIATSVYTPSQVHSVEQYLGNKWGIAIT